MLFSDEVLVSLSIVLQSSEQEGGAGDPVSEGLFRFVRVGFNH